MPSDTCGMNHKQRAYFNFNSDGVGDVSRDEPGQLLPSTSEDYPGVVYDFPPDVIKLRIGKVIEMPGRKTKFEYQFITPAVTNEKVVPVKDTRTAQCTPCWCTSCCHVVPPKMSALPSLRFNQDLKEDHSFTSTNKQQFHAGDHIINLFKPGSSVPCSEIMSSVDEYLLSSYLASPHLSTESFQQNLLTSSLFAVRCRRPNLSFSDDVNYISKSRNMSGPYHISKQNNFFERDQIVCTLFHEFFRQRSSGTQATASLNKCLQVNSNNTSNTDVFTARSSSVGSSTHNAQAKDKYVTYNLPEHFRYSDLYYFGKKKAISGKGMGSSGPRTKPHKSDSENAAVQAKSTISTCGAQTNSKYSMCCTKAVSILDDRASEMPDIIATVSHIRIGPREPCPVQGLTPCIGPKCIAAVTDPDEKSPVKVSTVANPRRGVFEIVIRRMNGNPLAKNELMLEWTPPPSRPPPCGPPCGPCPFPPCRPSKCRMYSCKPARCYRKVCKKTCKRPCGPKRPCGLPCRRPCSAPCGFPCGLPCKIPCGSPCKVPCVMACKIPCGFPCLLPCSPVSCGSPCKRPCGSPCKRPCGSPCKRPCGSPCKRPCGIPCRRSCGMPCKRPCGIKPKCRRPCGVPCKRSCGAALPCKKLVCGVSLCKKKPCQPGASSTSPCRSPCVSPCRTPCAAQPCRLACGLFPCKKPCRGSPCRSLCGVPSGCRKCRASCAPPCPPSPCASPCSPPCCVDPCALPCKSSPCLRRCPIGFKKPRKSRSQPKIRARRKRISPCKNRSRKCSAVRCRSGPCVSSCCGSPCPLPLCAPPKCYGPFPFKARCCRSSCCSGC